jgi:hypothetical protein
MASTQVQPSSVETVEPVEAAAHTVATALLARRLASFRRSEFRHSGVVSEALLFWRSKSLRVQVDNVSSSGTMIRFSGPLEIGEDVLLEFDGFAALSGVVQWVKSGRVGIAFEEDAIQITRSS